MLIRRILVCVVLLLPATILASLTLTAQEPYKTTIRPEALPAAPVPPNVADRSDLFGNYSSGNRRLTFNNFAGTASWRNENASPVTKAFAALKDAETDKDKSTAKTELRDALAADYDDKMGQYDEHIELLEKELEEMRDRLSRRRAAKEEMVDLKLKEMLANADGLGWPGSPTRNTGRFQRSIPRFPAKLQEGRTIQTRPDNSRGR